VTVSGRIGAAILLALLLVPMGSESRAARPAPVVPRLVGTLDLGGTAGGAHLGDVDGDGALDAVTLRGGRVAAVTAAGAPLFERFLGADELAAVRDLDGDGRAEIVFVNRATRTVGAFDARAQTVRWQILLPESADLDAAYVRVADLEAARPGLETVVFPDFTHTLGDAFGYFVSAAGEVYARPAVRNTNCNQLNYPQMAVANVDNAGDPEVVVVGRPRLLVFGSNGQLRSELEFKAGDPEGRHYGTLSLANVDADPDLEAVVVADRIAQVTPEKSHAVTVFDLAPATRELWRMVLPHGQTLESIPGGVADFDGDGRADLAVNHFDGATQAVELYRGAGDPARPGAPLLLCREPNAFAWDAVELAGAGAPELLASATNEAAPSLSFRSRLVVFGTDVAGGGCRLRPIGDAIADARYATRPLRALDREELATSAWADRTGVATIRTADGPAVVTYTRGEGEATRLQLRAVAAGRLKSLDGGRRPGTIRAVASTGVVLVAEGEAEDAADTLAFYRWDAQRGDLARVGTFRSGGFDAAAPQLADLDGDAKPELVVRRPGRRIAVYTFDPATGRFAERWAADGNAAPVIDAASGRVYVVAPDNKGRVKLEAHGSNGRVLWRTKFLDLPASTRPELAVGHFTAPGESDVWVSASRQRSWLVRGRDGQVVWESDAVFSYDNRAAVGDVDDDRVDDLVVVGNATYGVYGGRDGRPIHGPVDVRQLGGDLYATPLLAGDGTVVLSAPGTLARARLSGKKVWSVARAVQRTSDALLVGLARDARGEVVRVGGNFGPYDRFTAYEFKDGDVAFTTAHIPTTDVVTADTDRDGVAEFVFGTADGRVVALRSDSGAEVWSIDVGAFAGAPVFGGGLLAVPVADGTVRLFAF
jgi:outer membrane protein assembly factor BamB